MQCIVSSDLSLLLDSGLRRSDDIETNQKCLQTSAKDVYSSVT
ncbi:MAG: hypothetical protein RI962_1343 [Pseudomonadota bacterium]